MFDARLCGYTFFQSVDGQTECLLMGEAVLVKVERARRGTKDDNGSRPFATKAYDHTIVFDHIVFRRIIPSTPT